MKPNQESLCATSVDQAVQEFLGFCKAKKEFVGLALMSNQAQQSSRTSDEQSDIDLDLYISLPHIPPLEGSLTREFLSRVQPLLPQWLPYFDFIAPVLGGIEVNVHQRIIECDERIDARWSESRREAYASGFDLLYDPTGRIAKVINEKLCWYPGEKESNLAFRLARAFWDTEASIIQAERGRVLSAHTLLNHAVENTLCATCYVADIFPPSGKWLWDIARQMPALSKDDIDALEAGMMIKDLSKEEVYRRQAIITKPVTYLYEIGKSIFGMDPGDFFNSCVSTERQIRSLSNARQSLEFKSPVRGQDSWFLTEPS